MTECHLLVNVSTQLQWCVRHNCVTLSTQHGDGGFHKYVRYIIECVITECITTMRLTQVLLRWIFKFAVVRCLPLTL